MLRRAYTAIFLLSAALLTAPAALASLGVAEPDVEGRHLWGVKDPAEGFHHLWEEVILDLVIIGVLFSIATIYLMIRYRRRSADQQGRPPKLSATMMLGWALIPTFIFMADDLFLAAEGWTLWNKYRNVPEERYEIQLESAMWSWNFTYPGGVTAVNELRVPAKKPILVRMTSRDVVHSLFLPDFKVKEDSMPGRITYLWFYPKAEGEYLMTCAEFCGVMHSAMHGKVIVMPEAEFTAWIDNETAKLRAEQEGGQGNG
jgi:cytochrome c oxidase subunit 2